MSQKLNQRKLSNVVVDNKALLRLSIPFILLISLNIGVVTIIYWSAIQQQPPGELNTPESLSALLTYNQILSAILEIGIFGMIVSGIVCSILWLLYSHRIFGPSVPIRRHIKELCDGNFTSRVRLRKYDEFKDIADELNLLAEKLEKISF